MLNNVVVRTRISPIGSDMSGRRVEGFDENGRRIQDLNAKDLLTAKVVAAMMKNPHGGQCNYVAERWLVMGRTSFGVSDQLHIAKRMWAAHEASVLDEVDVSSINIVEWDDSPPAFDLEDTPLHLDIGTPTIYRAYGKYKFHKIGDPVGDDEAAIWVEEDREVVGVRCTVVKENLN